MRFLLSAVGSAGDVHPFIAIGVALAARGHAVCILAPPPFGERVRAAGLEFAALGEPEDFERVVRNAALWDARRGPDLVFDALLSRLPEAYETTAALVDDGTVLVGSTLAWGVRLVQERTGLPGATIHLSPACLLSASRPAVMAGVGDLAWLPLGARRLALHAVERWFLDRRIRPRMNAFRATLGLVPVRDVWSRWMNSPDLVVGAWPAWFAPAQPDWPSHTRTLGFPLFAEHGDPLPAAIEAFLASGPPPIGFTPGSAMAHGERFFANALATSAALGLRALLITPYRDQLPVELPSWARQVDYAPFTTLLPRLSAIVHHGGIGTSAQALAAGIPQAVVPFAHDQFDNAARLERLGVSRTLKLAASTGRWCSKLREMLDDPAVAAAAARHAERMRGDAAAPERIAIALEGLGGRFRMTA